MVLVVLAALWTRWAIWQKTEELQSRSCLKISTGIRPAARPLLMTDPCLNTNQPSKREKGKSKVAADSRHKRLLSYVRIPKNLGKTFLKQKQRKERKLDMVFFSCDGCSESLKKSHVDAHAARCRSCQSVTCVDCMVSFYGGEHDIKHNNQAGMTKLLSISMAFIITLSTGSIKNVLIKQWPAAERRSSEKLLHRRWPLHLLPFHFNMLIQSPFSF